jgi:mannosyltransferase OCH1-like enzyme
MKIIGITILIIALLIGIAFGSGLLDLKFYEFFGVRKANIQREIFKENKSYIEGMISDLSKYKYEYEMETDEVAKMAIANLIRDKFANFDSSNIESSGLKQFLIQIRGF